MLLCAHLLRESSIFIKLANCSTAIHGCLLWSGYRRDKQWGLAQKSSRFPPISVVWVKACVDLPDRRARFCKIHHVGHKGSVAVELELAAGSPSLKLWANPQLSSCAVRSTFMMETKFNGPNDTTRKFGSTGFMVAPGLGLSAGHCIDEYDLWGHRGLLSSIQGCKGAYIPPSVFKVDGFNCKQLWSVNNLRGSSAPLNQCAYKGVDLCIISIVTGEEQDFILPCSPAYENCKEVAVYSYPHSPAWEAKARGARWSVKRKSDITCRLCYTCWESLLFKCQWILVTYTGDVSFLSTIVVVVSVSRCCYRCPKSLLFVCSCS